MQKRSELRLESPPWMEGRSKRSTMRSIGRVVCIVQEEKRASPTVGAHGLQGHRLLPRPNQASDASDPSTCLPPARLLVLGDRAREMASALAQYTLQQLTIN